MEITDSGKIIAIIDDDPHDLEIMKVALNDFDPSFRCISFLFPEEALRVISDELRVVPQFIFIDLNMPGKTGFQCLRELRSIKEFKSVSIVMYSSRIQKEVKEALIDAGADYVFEKPAHEKWPLMVRKIFEI